MEALIDSLKIRVVVVEGVIPYPDATEAELDVFSHRIWKHMLLSALVPYNPMLVDSLMNDKALTYEDSKNRLLATPSSQIRERINLGDITGGVTESVGNAAMVAEGPQQSRKRSRNDTGSSGAERVECFYCHKTGHKKNECWKRKAALVDKLEKDKSEENAKGSGSGSSSGKTEKALVAKVTEPQMLSDSLVTPYEHVMAL